MSLASDVRALRERDPGLRCAYCCTRLALPLPQTGDTEDEWEAVGWELRLLPDGEPVWQLADGFVLAHREHVHPVARGGPDHIDNFVLACETCNQAKKAHPLILFLAMRSGCPRFKSVGGDHRETFARAWCAA